MNIQLFITGTQCCCCCCCENNELCLSLIS